MSNSIVRILIWTFAAQCAVASHAEPPDGIFEMVPQWEIDPYTADPLIGYVDDAVVDGFGTAYLLDAQLADIKVVDNTGRIVRVLGRAGDGPGEFRVPGEIFFFPDSSLGIISKFSGNLTRLDHETGLEIETCRMDLRASDGIVLNQVLSVEAPYGTMLAATLREWTGSRFGMRTVLGLIDMVDGSGAMHAGSRLQEVGEYQDDAFEEENYFLLWRPWTVDSSGRIVAAPYWDSYKLRWFGLEGKPVQEATLPFAPRPRTEAEKGRLLALWGGTDPEPVNGLRLVLAAREAVVREIYPRPGGTLWIRTNRAGFEVPSGTFMHLDELDASGAFVRSVNLRGPGNEGSDRVIWGPDNMIIVIHGSDDANPWSRPPNAPEPVPAFSIAAYRLVEVGD